MLTVVVFSENDHRNQELAVLVLFESSLITLLTNMSSVTNKNALNLAMCFRPASKIPNAL